MAADVKIYGVLGKLSKTGRDVEAAVLVALDEIAAKVLNNAREGHPKAPPKERSTSKLDALRTATGEAGEFTGKLRFLTHTANLMNSIKIEPAKRVGLALQASVFSAIEYANDVEFGHVGSRAFPFMRPALEAVRPWGIARLRQATAEAL